MRIRSIAVFALLPALLLIGSLTGPLTSLDVGAQEARFRMEEPTDGGEYPFIPVDEITDADRASIQEQIRTNLERLSLEGKLEPARPEAVPLIWPVKRADGVSSFFVDAISNYVDHNALFPSQTRDWNCGSRTYDQASGYNHAGIDIFLWPFPWNSMDSGVAEIVAAAPGTIVFKVDGNPDRSCALGSGQWNAVYVRHSDNSVAWYGHMKTGSVTSKPVGSAVAAGEKLGTVGSSGNSTGPHLHFELYNGNNQLQDPFQGACNTMNANSWWTSQESYRVSRLNGLTTGSAAPFQPNCLNETTNLKTVFQPGESVTVTAFYRDNLTGLGAQFALVSPDGTEQTTWTHGFNQDYSASWWTFLRPLATNVPTGQWKVRAVYNGTTYETPFTVAVPVVIASGRVTTPTGNVIRNAVVSMVDPAGFRRTATTSSFGVYTFSDVPVGLTYTITVASKRYRFSPITQPINGNLSNLHFVGLE